MPMNPLTPAKKQRLLLVLLFVLIALFCSAAPRSAMASTNPNAAVRAVNSFSVELFKELSKSEKNLCVSPYSVSSALAMCYLGAEGSTAKEMERVLHFTQTISPSFAALQKRLNSVSEKVATIEVANALWSSIRMKLKPEYESAVKKYYRTPIRRLDYANKAQEAVATINSWTNQKTRGKIPTILTLRDINNRTSLVLTHAIYFRSVWLSGFNESATQEEPFHQESGAKTSVKLMYQSGGFSYADVGQARLLSLPYAKGEFDMVFILPRDTFPQLLKQLNPKALESWLGALRSTTVRVYIPKFKQEQRLELKEPLQNLGMERSFTNGADFSGMGTMDGNGTQINQVIHKTFIEVSEKKTEAAAVTAIVMKETSPGPGNRPPAPEPILFRADHPFLYLIRDRTTGVILFIGRYMEPKKD